MSKWLWKGLAASALVVLVAVSLPTITARPPGIICGSGELIDPDCIKPIPIGGKLRKLT